ncbi:recombination mediator RecR [Opitutaceae bacterium]|nr:recombination mediator RecR [Opitutaceae bacterium]
MTPSLEHLQHLLKKLPGLGFRSAERVALHLLLEKPETLPALVDALQQAATAVKRCEKCGHLAEDALCEICQNEKRDQSVVCVVEQVPDVVALERSGAYQGSYHVLHGKLSPLQGVGPEHLNLAALRSRIEAGEVKELILALSNDVEGEATCHYLSDELIPDEQEVSISRIGFGLPSGGGVLYADSVTLKSALDGRRSYS